MPHSSPDAAGPSQYDPDRLELLALRTVTAALRDGLSLEGMVEHCLDQALRHLGLDFGCLYVRRHNYLLRLASRGLALAAGPDHLLPLAEAPWAARPFLAEQRGDEGTVPEDLHGKAWMSGPIRIGSELIGVLLVGGYGRAGVELPPFAVVRRMTEHLAIGIDNAERLQQVRGLLNDTRDVIFRTDAHGRWTYLNSVWQELVGETIGSSLGRRAVGYLEESHRRRVGHGVEALVPRGAVNGRQTLPFVVRGGEVRWMDIQARLIRDDSGRVIGTAGVLRDVTLQVQQARELQQANDTLREHARELEAANRSLAEADRLKSEFLATVSHELRTPLGLVLGYNELMLDGVPDEPTEGQREYLELVREGGQRLERLILQLLDLARIEAGWAQVEARPTPLSLALSSAWSRALRRAEAAGVGLEVPPAGPLVLAHPERLEQVIDLLLDNAVKFNRRGGQVAVRVDLRVAAEPVLNGHPAPAGPHRFAQVTVVDTGVGIHPERRALLFQKFVQADGGDTRRHGGLGLGLVVGRALVEMMGGRIDVHSAGENQGTSVGFTVPLASA